VCFVERIEVNHGDLAYPGAVVHDRRLVAASCHAPIVPCATQHRMPPLA
jgi:hypothetical protein